MPPFASPKILAAHAARTVVAVAIHVIPQMRSPFVTNARNIVSTTSPRNSPYPESPAKGIAAAAIARFPVDTAIEAAGGRRHAIRGGKEGRRGGTRGGPRRGPP